MIENERSFENIRLERYSDSPGNVEAGAQALSETGWLLARLRENHSESM